MAEHCIVTAKWHITSGRILWENESETRMGNKWGRMEGAESERKKKQGLRFHIGNNEEHLNKYDAKTKVLFSMFKARPTASRVICM